MLTVITFNLANYDDHANWDKRRQIFTAIVEDCDADIVAFQEVRFDAAQPTTKTSYLNMGEQIAASLSSHDYNTVCQWAQYYDPVTHAPTCRQTTLWEGLGILSRKPVVETGTLFLSANNCPDLNHRITQYAAFKVSKGTLYLFNTHFSTEEECISSNVNETLTYMARFKSPKVLVGDLNATPDSPSIKTLMNTFQDAWSLVHPQDPGYTYPSDNPNERIDYVFLDGASLGDVQLIGTKPVGGIYASDHLGLVVKLAV